MNQTAAVAAINAAMASSASTACVLGAQSTRPATRTAPSSVSATRVYPMARREAANAHATRLVSVSASMRTDISALLVRPGANRPRSPMTRSGLVASLVRSVSRVSVLGRRLAVTQLSLRPIRMAFVLLRRAAVGRVRQAWVRW